MAQDIVVNRQINYRGATFGSEVTVSCDQIITYDMAFAADVSAYTVDIVDITQELLLFLAISSTQDLTFSFSGLTPSTRTLYKNKPQIWIKDHDAYHPSGDDEDGPFSDDTAIAITFSDSINDLAGIFKMILGYETLPPT